MAQETQKTIRERELAEAQKSLENLRARRKDLDADIEAAERLVQAHINFRLTLEGKFAPTTAPAPERKPRAPSGTRAKRGEIGGLRKEVHDYVSQHHDGLEAKHVQTHFNPSRDKKRGTQISAALYKLKDDGYLDQPSGTRGPYVAVVKPQQSAPTPTAELEEEEATA